MLNARDRCMCIVMCLGGGEDEINDPADCSFRDQVVHRRSSSLIFRVVVNFGYQGCCPVGGRGSGR